MVHRSTRCNSHYPPCFSNSGSRAIRAAILHRQLVAACPVLRVIAIHVGHRPPGTIMHPPAARYPLVAPWGRKAPVGHSSAHRSSSRFTRRSSAKARRKVIISADRPPCIVRAFLILSTPSTVRGPVLLPPCSRHRALPFIAGDRHGVPLRVRAPHRAHACANGNVVRQSGRRLTGFCA